MILDFSPYILFFALLFNLIPSYATVHRDGKLIWIQEEFIFAGACEDGRVRSPANCPAQYQYLALDLFEKVDGKIKNEIEHDQKLLDQQIHWAKVDHPSIAPIQTAIQQIGGQIRSLETQLIELGKEIKLLEQKIAQQDGELLIVIEFISDYESQLAAIEEKLKIEPENKTFLRKKIEIKKSLDQKKFEKDMLIARIENSKKELAQKNATKTQIEQSLTELNAQLSDLKKEYDKAYQELNDDEMTSPRIERLRSILRFNHEAYEHIQPVFGMIQDEIIRYNYFDLNKIERKVLDDITGEISLSN